MEVKQVSNPWHTAWYHEMSHEKQPQSICVVITTLFLFSRVISPSEPRPDHDLYSSLSCDALNDTQIVHNVQTCSNVLSSIYNPAFAHCYI